MERHLTDAGGQAVEAALAGEPDCAGRLGAGEGGMQRGAGGGEARARSGNGIALVIQAPCGQCDRVVCGAQLGGSACEWMADRLEVADALAELLPVASVLGGEGEQGLSRADDPGGASQLDEGDVERSRAELAQTGDADERPRLLRQGRQRF